MKTVDLRQVTNWDEFWALGRYTRCNWTPLNSAEMGPSGDKVLYPSVQLKEATRLILQDGTVLDVPERTQVGRRSEQSFFFIIPGEEWRDEWELTIDQFADDPRIRGFDL